MPDPRIKKLAKVLINYSLGINSGQKFYISSSPLSIDLALAVYEEAIKVGAHVLVEQPLKRHRKFFINLLPTNN